MAKIHVLSEDIARRIAAGEVVERPASVVKELIENSVDAGAKTITVRTRGAGVSLIEVSDDGCGMAPDDLALAVKSFSTSKISDASDLLKIDTYGFRGEALASISAVSRFEIVSAEQTGGEGFRYRVEGKNVLDRAPAPREKGTTVRVENLFFNTPARKKFLKSDVTERRRILEVVLSFASIMPDLEFHYSEDDRPVLDLVRAASWEDRVSALLGSGTMTHMVEVDFTNGPLQLTGWTSLPTHTRSNRNHQFIYVNRRLVKEKTVLQAVQQAYRSVIPYKRFPVAVLSLVVPPTDVDVNVHPNKLEVRLSHPRLVFETVSRGVGRALSGRAEPSLEVSYIPSSPKLAGKEQQVAGDSGPSGHLAAVEPAYQATTVEERKKRVHDATFSYMTGSARKMDFNPQLSLKTSGSKPEFTKTITEKLEADEALFWQFNNAFIFIQVRGGLVVIDQHAAHERIIYDTSKGQLSSEIPVSQQILFPINLELSLKELEAFRTSGEVFEKLGFHLEPFGGTSILVRGYPQGLKNWNEGALLRQIFDDIIEERFPGQDHADRIIASFACRSAVKAGQKLSVPEMKMLADQLFAIPNPYSCPHGRPTIQRISLDEIESWFLRR
jgi:DNA mismatch repair protein MutL